MWVHLLCQPERRLPQHCTHSRICTWMLGKTIQGATEGAVTIAICVEGRAFVLHGISSQELSCPAISTNQQNTVSGFRVDMAGFVLCLVLPTQMLICVHSPESAVQGIQILWKEPRAFPGGHLRGRRWPSKRAVRKGFGFTLPRNQLSDHETNYVERSERSLVPIQCAMRLGCSFTEVKCRCCGQAWTGSFSTYFKAPHPAFLSRHFRFFLPSRLRKVSQTWPSVLNSKRKSPRTVY